MTERSSKARAADPSLNEGAPRLPAQDHPSAFPAVIPHPGDLDNASLVTSPPTFAFLCVPLHTHSPEGRLQSDSSFWNNHRFAEQLQKWSRGWLCTLHAASLHAPRLASPRFLSQKQGLDLGTTGFAKTLNRRRRSDFSSFSANDLSMPGLDPEKHNAFRHRVLTRGIVLKAQSRPSLNSPDDSPHAVSET